MRGALLCVPEEKHLVWLRKELGKHYVLKAKVVGPEKIDEKSVEFLGPRLAWTQH